MCVLKFWFSVFLFFGYAFLLTTITGKRKYCARQCPLDNLQVVSYRDKENDNERRRVNKETFIYHLVSSKWIMTGVAIVFWGYLIYTLIVFFQNPAALWQRNLLLMLSAAGIALILQQVLYNRVWCTKLCPFGSVLKVVSKIRNSSR